jgi:hypothetical protein
MINSFNLNLEAASMYKTNNFPLNISLKPRSTRETDKIRNSKKLLKADFF